jgi:hypothetical protein
MLPVTDGRADGRAIGRTGGCTVGLTVGRTEDWTDVRNRADICLLRPFFPEANYALLEFMHLHPLWQASRDEHRLH